MPSLYETTAAVGEVSSSNFTTLYNSSGLSAPNTGGGAVSGNLNIAGNLTVQGTSLLQGAVTLGSSLSLPGFTMPTGDGSTDQVIVTNGSGQLSWASVQTLPGASYTIQADTTTGGANLSLVSSLATDSVKFAGGTNITVSRTDASTITISTVADNIPDGTAAGQVLEWDGSAWTANNVVTTLTPTGRLVAEYKDNTTNIVSSFGVRRNTGSTPFTTGTISSSIYQLDSDSQAVTSFGSMGFAYDASNPIFAVATSTDNFSTRTFITNIDKNDVKFNGTNLVLNSNFSGTPSQNATITVERGSSTDATITWNETNDRWDISNDAQVAGDLAVNGGDITTTSTTGNLFNTNATVVNIGDAATTEVNLGSAVSGRVQIKPSTIVGANTTQNVFNTVATTVNAFGAATAVNMGANTGTMTIGNPTVVGTQTTQNLYNTTATTVNAFGAATAVNIGASTGLTTIGHDLSINGTTLKINADGSSSPVDNYIYFNGTNESLKWNQGDTRFELSDQLYISQTEPAAVFERRVTTAEVSPSEAKGAIRLFERVTDAVSNATDDAGPSVNFGRTYGASGGTERLFASMGSVWYGTTNKARLQFNWSTDDFTEPTPGVFPQTYTLLSLDSDYANFFNNSLYVDYAHVDSTKTATSITGGNTLVFGSAHGYSAGDRILYQTATQNGLTQSTYYYVLAAGLTTTQCRISNQSGGTAVTLTNGTGLTLTFAQVSNRVGVNTTTPGYTLDVDGDAHVATDLTVDGDIYVSGVHVDLTTPVHQGQLLYVSNDVSPTITNSSTIVANNASYRPVFQYDNNSAGVNSGVFARKNYGSSTYTTNDGVAYAFQLQSNTQTTNQIATIAAQWDASAPLISLNTNINNNTAGPFVSVAGFTSAQATLPGDLAVNGGDITTTQTTASVFNTTATTVDIAGAATTVNIGANTGTTTINNDLDVDGNANALSYTIDGTRAKIDTGYSTTWATGTTITLTTTDKNLEKAMFYITDGTDVHAVEALVLRNGATAMLTTYGEMYSSTALATFTADISAGALRIRGTNTTATTLTVSVVATSLL